MKNESLLSTGVMRKLDLLRSERAHLAREIADILDLDENSVYRRLRGDVRFSADEIGLLAYKFDFSLDSIVGDYHEGDYDSWKIDLPLIYDSAGYDMDILEKSLAKIEKLVEGPDTEMGGAFGCLTRQFFMYYKEISRFMLFKWDRYYSEARTFDKFKEVEIQPPMMELFNLHLLQYRKVRHAFFIWDSLIFTKLINDIRYYKSMSMMDDEDVAMIKQDVHRLLHDCESAAAEGKFGDTGNAFDLYISPINIDTSHAYLRNADHGYYSVEVYGIKSFWTTRPHIRENLHKSIDNLKNASVLISGSAEKERRVFFNRQRELVETL